MLSKNIEVFMGCEWEPEEADTILFGAPFDSTTSYRPGTRFGSGAIRHEAYGLEDYSPYQDKDLSQVRTADIGDLELCIGDTEKVLEQIEACAGEILAAGKRPFMLGGEHLVTLGAFRAAVKKYPDIHIVHFDAHADLAEDYLLRGGHYAFLRWYPDTDTALWAEHGREGGDAGFYLPTDRSVYNIPVTVADGTGTVTLQALPAEAAAVTVTEAVVEASYTDWEYFFE